MRVKLFFCRKPLSLILQFLFPIILILVLLLLKTFIKPSNQDICQVKIKFRKHSLRQNYSSSKPELVPVLACCQCSNHSSAISRTTVATLRISRLEKSILIKFSNNKCKSPLGFTNISRLKTKCHSRAPGANPL